MPCGKGEKGGEGSGSGSGEDSKSSDKRFAHCRSVEGISYTIVGGKLGSGWGKGEKYSAQSPLQV